MDAFTIYGCAINQALPYGGYEYALAFSDELRAAADDSEIGHSAEVDLEYIDTMKNRKRYFPIGLDSKKVDKEFLLHFVKKRMILNHRP